MCGKNAELMNNKQDGTLHYTELSNTLIHNFEDGIALLLSRHSQVAEFLFD
jgi:hypothetical protein